MLSPP
jgi:hypothetical protein